MLTMSIKSIIITMISICESEGTQGEDNFSLPGTKYFVEFLGVYLSDVLCILTSKDV